jgi:hypothetical protein
MCACDRDGLCPRCVAELERDEWPEPYEPETQRPVVSEPVTVGAA